MFGGVYFTLGLFQPFVFIQSRFHDTSTPQSITLVLCLDFFIFLFLE